MQVSQGSYPESLQDGVAQRTSNIQLGRSVDIILSAVWVVSAILGFAVMFVLKKPFFGAVVIGIPTMIGMVIKPGFALSVMMLTLASGTGIAVEGKFSLNKGVGMALAVSFFLNIMFSRPNLRLNRAAVWFAIAFFGWSIFSAFVNNDYFLVSQVLTKVQFMIFILLVFWVLDTNTELTFKWVLRSFFIGTIGTILLSFVTGTAIRSMEEGTEGRFTATAGGAINANILAALVAIAMLSAVYLAMIDAKIRWRLIYIGGVFFLSVFLFKSGSRGTVIALFGAFCVSFMGKHILRNVKYLLMAMAAMVIFLGIGYFLLKTGRLNERVAERLTDVYQAKTSIEGRMTYNIAAIKAASRSLTGTGYYKWFEQVDVDKLPHNAFLFATGVYGFPGGLLYLCFVVSLVIMVGRIPSGPEKIFAVSILTFLILITLKGAYISEHFYWMFIGILLACDKFGRERARRELFYISQEENWEQSGEILGERS